MSSPASSGREDAASGRSPAWTPDAAGARRDAAIVLVVAAAAQLSFFATTGPFAWPDSRRYAILALDFPHRLATAFWDLWTVPGYPGFLWLVTLFARNGREITLVQHLLAIAACLSLWAGVRRLLGPRLALLAAIIVALSPSRHYYAGTLLSESLAESAMLFAVGLLTLAAGGSPGTRIALRAASGLCFGLAAVTRPNLVCAILPAALAPVRAASLGGRWQGYAGAVAATALGWAILVVPWVVFNSERGVVGLAGNAGALMSATADGRDLGPPRHAVDLGDGEGYTAKEDFANVLDTLGRYVSYPLRYASAAAVAGIRLALPELPLGDVGGTLRRCDAIAPSEPLEGIALRPPRGADGWRCHVHTELYDLWTPIATAGWIGLLVWFAAALSGRRFDEACVAAIPLVCLLGLALILHATTRYIFPVEGLAAGLGVAGAVAAIGDRVRRRRAGAGDGAGSGALAE